MKSFFKTRTPMINLKSYGVLITGALFLISCNNNKNVADLLKDEKKKDEVMNTISNDPLLVAGFADHLSKSAPGIDALAGSKDLMKQLHAESRIGIMLKNDSSMAETTLSNLANVAAKDSASARNLGNAVLNNEKMRRVIEDILDEKSKSGKEKKHSGHKKHKHSK
jgi:hypothetical protein